MTNSWFESLSSTFLGILSDLQLLQELAATAKFNEHAANNTNGEEMAKLLTNLAAEVERTRPGSGILGNLRKRSRKQEKHNISRLDVAKAEEEEILERLKKEECRRFVHSFREVLPNFTPDDAVLKESDGLDWHLEMCKRLAGRVGMFVRENDVQLEEHGKKAEELGREVHKEEELREELIKEVEEMDKKIRDVHAAATEGSKTDCQYCFMICQEIGEQKSQKVSVITSKLPNTDDLISFDTVAILNAELVQRRETPAGLAPKGNHMSSEVHLLNPLTKELDGHCEEMEFTNSRTNATKSDPSEKANEISQYGMLGVDSKNHSALPERQKTGTVTKVFVRRKTKDVVLSPKILGKETNVKLTDVNGDMVNESKEGTGKLKHGENGAVESKEYQTNFSTVKETDAKLTSVSWEIEKECEGTRKKKQKNMNSDECFKQTGCAANHLTKSLELAKEYEFIEIKCGCTSLKDVDKTGILRIYKSGLLEIYCKCKEGCNEGRPMSPPAFEMHVGHGVKRKWKESIWIDMGHKVQLSKVEELELYCQKYEEMMNVKTRSTTCKIDSSIPDKKIPEKRRLRPRKRKVCNIHHTILKTRQKSPKLRPDRWRFNCTYC